VTAADQSRDFRFGVYLTQALDRSAIIDRCQAVEELGFDVISPIDSLGCLPPIAAMLLAAEATSRVRICPLVISVGFYNPMLLARDLIAADICTGGRIEAGLGTGFVPDQFAKLGVPFGSPGERIDHLLRAVRAFRTSCADPEEISPVQQPAPPVLLGGGGPRMLRAAVEHADIVGLQGGYSDAAGAIHMSDATQLTERVQLGRDHAATLGRNPELNIHVYECVVTDDRAGELERIATRDEARDLSPAQLGELPSVLVGSVEEIVSQLHAHRERFGISYFSIRNEDADGFGAVLRVMRGGAQSS
jgi:probable F420-dependent oxidoreductase